VIVALAQFWSLPAAILAGYGAAGGIALINSVGNLAGFFTPSIIGAVKTATGSTDAAILGVAAIIALGGLLTLAVPRSLVDGNRAAASRQARSLTEVSRYLPEGPTP
jgi:nitrate/nitrite transporter NarK